MTSTSRAATMRALLALCAAAVASSQTLSTLEIPVRVHMLRSTVADLNSSASSFSEVDAIFTDVNTLWSPAGIQWVLQDVLYQDARFESEFVDQVVDQTDLPKILMAPANETVFTPDETFSNSSGVFNVIFIRRLRSYGSGVYNHRTLSLLHAEEPDRDEPNTTPASRLAADLGQMLSLMHTDCWHNEGNLMAVRCESSNSPARELDSCQIAEARALASTTSPWSRSGDGTCPCDGCKWALPIIWTFTVGAVASILVVVAVVGMYARHLKRRRKREAGEEQDHEEWGGVLDDYGGSTRMLGGSSVLGGTRQRKKDSTASDDKGEEEGSGDEDDEDDGGEEKASEAKAGAKDKED